MQCFKIILILLLSIPLMAQHGQYVKGFDCPTCTKSDENETITGSWRFNNNEQGTTILLLNTGNIQNTNNISIMGIDGLSSGGYIQNKTRIYLYSNNKQIKFQGASSYEWSDIWQDFYKMEWVDGINSWERYAKHYFYGQMYLYTTDCSGNKYLTLDNNKLLTCNSLPSETDPVWTSEKSSYYTKTETDNLLSGKVPYTGATSNVNLGSYEITSAKVNTSKIDIADGGTRPECNSDNRGLIWNDEGSTGYSDMLSICVKGSDDTYYWQELYSEQYDPDGWDGKNEMNCFSTGICHEYYQNSFPYSWQGTAPNTIEWKKGYYTFVHNNGLTTYASYDISSIVGDFELQGKYRKDSYAKVFIFIADTNGTGYAIGSDITYNGYTKAQFTNWGTPSYTSLPTYENDYPYVKLKRVGTDLYGYISKDGIKWAKYAQWTSISTTFKYIGWLITIDSAYGCTIDWLRFKQ